MPTADLELTIQPDGDAYVATARLTPPGSEATATLAQNVPVRVDRAVLLAAALDAEAYGRQLTAMLFADQRLRDAWREARGFACGAQTALRLRLDSAADDLHSLGWETIRDPITDTPLARNQQVLFSRYLDASDLTSIRIPDCTTLAALVVVAAPTDLDQYGLAPIDATSEVARVTAALGDIPTTILAPMGNGQRATLAQLAAALHDSPPILYLVAHGTCTDGQPYLWLEHDDGTSHWVAGAEVAQLVAGLTTRPLLIILAACDGAGQHHNDHTLVALGPLLARAGVGAVIAMHGAVIMESIAQLMPPLFRELRRDGQIDRALAAARAALSVSPDWWRPVLFLRVVDGTLFAAPRPVVPCPPGPPQWWERMRHHPLFFFPTVAVVVLSAILALVVGGIDAINGFPQARQRLQEWEMIDGIQPEQSGETLLVVVPFYHSGGVTNTEPDVKIRRAILQAAADTGLTTLRVELAPRTLRADDRAGAEQLAQRSNASIIVWGEDTGVEVIVSFLNHKQPTFDAPAVTITERERTQLANPSAYARFITTDLPGEMTFLSLFAIGQSYYATKQFDLARTVIAKATQAIPDESTIEGLADAFFRLGWLHQEPGGELTTAITAYTSAIRLNPALAGAFNNRGHVYLSQDTFDLAITDFTKVIHLAPTFAGAFNNRGDAYLYQRKFDLAITDFTEAIRLDPVYAEAFANRGTAYSVQGKGDLAITDYSEAIRINPTLAGAFYGRGSTYAAHGHYALAITDFTEAIRLNPSDANAFNNRGATYSDQGQSDLAITDFTEAIRLNPTFAMAFYNRGNAYSKQGQSDLAITDFTEVIRLNPTDADALYNRGNIYVDQGKIDLAMKDYIETIRINPTYASAFNQLCWWGSLLNRAANVTVVDACEQAVTLASDQNRPSVRDSRGLNRALIGNYAGAIEDFTAFVTESQQSGKTDATVVSAIARRETWIAALRVGQNPFDVAMLKSLREE